MQASRLIRTTSAYSIETEFKEVPIEFNILMRWANALGAKGAVMSGYNISDGKLYLEFVQEETNAAQS